MDGLITLTDLSHRHRHRRGRSAGVATLDADGRLWVAQADADRLGKGRWSAAYRPEDGMLLLWPWRLDDGGWREPVRVRGGRSVGVRLAALLRSAGLPKPAAAVDLMGTFTILFGTRFVSGVGWVVETQSRLAHPVARAHHGAMGRRSRQEVTEDQLVGFKYFRKILRMLDRLHEAGCARDRAHHRQLHFDQYTALILLYFFNPILTSLRGIQQASALGKVQRKLGVPRASLGSLSEAARVFDSELLVGLIGELAGELRPMRHDARLDDVRGILTLVDGSTLGALPRLTQAMWTNSSGRGLKLHTHFELLKGVPVRMDLTDGGGSERAQLEQTLLPDRVYVMDRGYAAFALFDAIRRAGSSFVCRLRDNSVYEVLEDRPLTDADANAHVLSDQRVTMNDGKATLRLVRVRCTPHRKPYKIGRGGPEQGDELLIATDLCDADLSADVIALIYQQRWGIEIFFRFFKHVLGCRHLLSHAVNGIEVQTYSAIIACLLIALWTGRKPTLRTYEMLCFYFTGLASEAELTAHLDRLPPVVQAP